MKRSPMPHRKSELRRTSGGLQRNEIRRATVGRKTQRDDVPASVRRDVRERSQGWCECGCGRRAQHIHHRKLRSQGGKHELVNLLHLSWECHEAAHHAGNRARSEALGLIVPGWADPADVPVTRVNEVAA